MECRDIERSLDAYLDGEFDDRESAEAAAHLATCTPCRTLAERQERVREGMKRCLARAFRDGVQAPPALRLRIVEAIAHERCPWWRRALSPVPLGALAAAAAGVLFVLVTHGPAQPDRMVEEAARRHARDLPLEITAASVGPDSVSSWFAGKLDFNPRPPRFAAPDARLVGARLSHVGDRPAAYMRYELPRGHLGGLFIVEDRDRHCCEGGRIVQVGQHVIHLAAARGYNVAFWRRDEIVYSLVSDLDETQLAHLVESIAAQGDGREDPVHR